MIATCGGIGTTKVVRVRDFTAGIVGVNGVMRFLVLEEPMSTDGRQQFIPLLTPITIMRQLGANIRMQESGDVLEIEDDRGKTHTEKLVRERSGHVHNQLDFFSREGWKLPDSLRAQLKFDPFMASNRHEICLYGKYEFKDEKQTKLAPTAECYGLDALETVNTSTGETARDDELPEDLWPNLNAMVTRLQQLYIGNHEEKLTAREHGFDRDFWAGSQSDCTTKLYRVQVKLRSTMFDPRQCATSPIPAVVEIVSRKTYLRETRGRRVAQLEHNFNDDKDVWSGTVNEQLGQIQSAHDELRCYFADYKTIQIRPATTYDKTAESRICLLDLRDAPNHELEAIRQHIRTMQPYMLIALHNDDSPNDKSLRALCEQQANQGEYFLLNLLSCPEEQDSTWDKNRFGFLDQFAWTHQIVC